MADCLTNRFGVVWRRMLTGTLVLLFSGCPARVPAPGGPKVVPSGTSGSAAANSPPGTSAKFVDVTDSAQVAFTYRNGEEAGHFAILESLGGGVVLLDFDNDGALDLFFPGGGSYGPDQAILGRSPALFRNDRFRGDGSLRYANHTGPAGLVVAPNYYSHGAAAGDYDQDGHADLLVTGYGGVMLYRNQGDGTFQEVSQAAGLEDPHWSSSAAWGDVNGDGILDLYIAHYVNWSFANHPFCAGLSPQQRDVCAPKQFEGLPDVLYFGRGDGTFADASRQAGLRSGGKGLGVLMADIDADGDLDIYVANDTVDNFLYRNKGGGQFEEIGQESGTAVNDMGTPDGSMGVDLIDFNGDGRPDLWVANYENESFALYRNEGNCQFLHVSRPTGVSAVGGLSVGFGTVCFDFDGDGDEDVFVANGHVVRFPINAPLRQLPLLLENQSGKRFVNVAPGAGTYLSTPHIGRGVATGDLDGDGDLDLVVSHLNEPVSVLLNETANGNGWFRVRLIGTHSHRDAVGARLRLRTSAGDQWRQIKGGGSYLSQSDMRASWGVPQGASVSGLTIYWPAGGVQEISTITGNRALTVIEP